MPDTASLSRCLRFSSFEVDLRTGELRRHGAKVKLEGQPFQILASLLERPGQLVTREELQKKLWPSDTFVDFEHSINAAVKRLREALGDSADTPHFIETLPRRGYRFIGQVEGAAATSREMLGRYWVGEQIGAGGMGQVYRGRDEHLERDVALKILPAGALADEAARNRFRQEARALSKLNHPNIQTVHDFGSQDGVDYLVLEYIPGVTLDEKLVIGALKENEVVALGGQLAEGLVAAHEQGVLHRDLKPGNLRVMPDGRLKILDFGLAKLLRPYSDSGLTESVTETQGIRGTLPYMAPEQLRGEKADARSDIYSAGLVLYEMVTGLRAFREELAPRLTDAILHQAPVPPRAINGGISAELERVILKSLEKEPGKRYQSATELLIDLQRLGATSTTALAPVAPRRLRIPIAALGTAAAVLAVLLAANVGGVRDRLFSARATGPIRSVAVLPLENLSGEPQQQYLVDGIHDELVMQLASIGSLSVPSRTTVMRYREQKKSVAEIARELAVDAVVEGTVKRTGDRVRITVQLIHAPSDRHLWAQPFERDWSEMSLLPGEVARAIVAQLHIQLTPQEQAQLRNPRPVDPKAYDAYLMGRQHYDTGGGSETRVLAKKHLEEAIEIDPTFARAYASLAEVYVGGGTWATGPLEGRTMARKWATKALELDDSLEEAHNALAFADLMDWDWASAERGFRRAIELNPGYARARIWYAWYLQAMLRFDEALQQMELALQLEPESLFINFRAGWLYFRVNRLNEARACWQKILNLDPESISARVALAQAHISEGRYSDAIAQLEGRIRAGERDAFAIGTLACAYGFTGRRNEALRLARELEIRDAKGENVPDQPVAYAYVGLGDKDRAFAWLERVYVKHRGMFTVSGNRMYDPIKSDPRFANLLRRVGLPVENPDEVGGGPGPQAGGASRVSRDNGRQQQ